MATNFCHRRGEGERGLHERDGGLERFDGFSRAHSIELFDHLSRAVDLEMFDRLSRAGGLELFDHLLRAKNHRLSHVSWSRDKNFMSDWTDAGNFNLCYVVACSKRNNTRNVL